MEEGFSDGSSGALIGVGIFGGIFFSAVIGIGIGIAVSKYFKTSDNPTITTNQTLPPPTQGGKRRTRRSRPRRGTRRV